MANTALELCRIIRKHEGITLARFDWVGTEEIVFLVEGSPLALSAPSVSTVPNADYIRLTFVMEDNAKQTMSKRLTDPRTATASTRVAGR